MPAVTELLNQKNPTMEPDFSQLLSLDYSKLPETPEYEPEEKDFIESIDFADALCTLGGPLDEQFLESSMTHTPELSDSSLEQENEFLSAFLQTDPNVLSAHSIQSVDGMMDHFPVPHLQENFHNKMMEYLHPYLHKNSSQNPEPKPKKKIAGPKSSKPIKCPVPGCLKSYSNSNGLKYHLKHNHLTPGQILKMIECPMDNCRKEYRNLNGLKYHLHVNHREECDPDAVIRKLRLEQASEAYYHDQY
jgi:hypothetical protein